jgi:hypothetical protein
MERGSISPVAGALVRAEGQQALTDAAGAFALSLPRGRPVTLWISSDRHETVSVRVQPPLPSGPGARALEVLLLPRHEGARFSTKVRGDRNEGPRFSLEGDALRTQAGTLGDPFRVVGLLPGVATPIAALPLYVIRGASPGMNGFFLDGMRVPQLFHLLVGGGVVHARLVERLDFYPGAYNASLGRYAGGVIDADTRSARPGYHGEAELRIYDVSAVAELGLPKDVRLTVSGHYGFPGPIVKAIDDRIDLSYWDYQMRLDWKGLTVQALGSYDYVRIAGDQLRIGRVANEFRLTFHRVQVRERHRFGKLEVEAGIVGGIDESQAFGGFGVRKLSLNMRASLRGRWSRFRFHLGADTELSRFTPENFQNLQSSQGRMPGDLTQPEPMTTGGMPSSNLMAPDELGELKDDRNGVVAGAFLVATADLLPRLSLTLGGRLDVYHAGGVTLLGLDPRGQLRLRAQDWLTFTVGAGVYQQPPSFPVALPGIDTFALRLGLQRAVHGASGIETRLPWGLTLGATGYYQKFDNASDVALDFVSQVCTAPPSEVLTGGVAAVVRPLDGQSYGMELLLRRREGRVTGWIAYTLSRSERVYSCGLRPADYDQTHVLNVVAQVRLPWRLVASARFLYSSGRPVTSYDLSRLDVTDFRSATRNNSRLPDYVQLDVRLDREWLFRRFALAAFLEVVNVTYSTANLGLAYPDVSTANGAAPSTPLSLEPIGFAWILPSIGLRARF